MCAYNSKDYSKGLTFLEVVIAITLFAVALVGFFQVFNMGVNAGYRASQEIIAINLARALMAEIMTKEFIDPDYPAVRALGPNTGETGRSSFDDVDDYNGLSEKPAVTVGGLAIGGANYAVFSRSVTVQYCQIDASNNIVPISDPGLPDPIPDHKMITLTVSGPYVRDIKVIEVKIK